jgi:hypothetical protein
MREHANQEIIACFDLNFDPSAEDIAAQVSAALERSLSRAQLAAEGPLTKDKLAGKEASLKEQIEKSFADGTWQERLPGRDILKAFRADAKLDVSYEGFRNLIVSQMAEAGYKPTGMRNVLEQIVREVRRPKARSNSEAIRGSLGGSAPAEVLHETAVAGE